ncbi:MAG: hypothetical protein MJE66_07815, partial [Proteobacteria bacterium]|nr:hypothetical protein [Pseudomonadota bacterium]
QTAERMPEVFLWSIGTEPSDEPPVEIAVPSDFVKPGLERLDPTWMWTALRQEDGYWRRGWFQRWPARQLVFVT